MDGIFLFINGYGAANEGDRMEADHRRLDYRIFTDDEEVTLLPHIRDTEVPDNPDMNIRDRPDMSDT